MPVGIAELSGTVLECPDPVALTRFYADLTGWSVTYSDENWCTLAPAEGQQPPLAFQRASGYKPPVWPDPARPCNSTWTSK